MKKLLIIIVAIVLSLNMKAQTTAWLVSPEYDDIEFFVDGLYKVSKNGKYGIISTSGRTVVEPRYDVISKFFDGRAVIYNETAQGLQFKGVITDNGDVNFPVGTYYLIPKYPFYSEGFLPVSDGRGGYGYLNDECQPAFDFSDEKNLHPFCEGLAAVGSGSKFHWVTTTGRKIRPWLSSGGRPWGGTNFKDGEAYLWDEDGDDYIFTSSFESRRIKEPDLKVDYLYRIGTGKGSKIEYDDYDPDYDETYTPEQGENGKWSYLSESEKLIAPYTYDKVFKFIDDAAVAEQNGRYGLLHIIIDNSTFSVRVGKSHISFTSNGSDPCSFILDVPKKWRNSNLSVRLFDDGDDITLRRRGNNSYTFNYKPSASVRKNFDVKVFEGDNEIWAGSAAYSFTKANPVAPSPSSNGTVRRKVTSGLRVIPSLIVSGRANSNDRCGVSAAIKNPSSYPVSVTVRLTGGGSKASFTPVSKTISIPAHASRTIYTSFLVKKVETNGWCTVSCNDGATVSKTRIQMSPF